MSKPTMYWYICSGIYIVWIAISEAVKIKRLSMLLKVNRTTQHRAMSIGSWTLFAFVFVSMYRNDCTSLAFFRCLFYHLLPCAIRRLFRMFLMEIPAPRQEPMKKQQQKKEKTHWLESSVQMNGQVAAGLWKISLIRWEKSFESLIFRFSFYYAYSVRTQARTLSCRP